MYKKITESIIKQLTEDRKKRLTYKELAKKYSLSIPTVFSYLNPEYRESVKLWKKEHRTEVKESVDKFHKSPQGMWCKIRNNSLYRNMDFNIKKEAFFDWYFKQEQKCFYCGRILEEINRSKDAMKKRRLTIDRIDSNKGYQLDNIVLCCARCNSTKSNFFTYEDMLEIGKIVKRRSDSL